MRYALLALPYEFGTRPSYVNVSNVLLRRSLFRHPVFAWSGLRPALAQHTSEEHAALKRWAVGRQNLVEIGVAEGVSALALREAMSSTSTLYLVDPFHVSRHPWLNAVKRTARRLVESCPNGKVVWLVKFSCEASREWTRPVDFVFLDGDHSEPAVKKDWDNWSRLVVPGGVVVFHDARVFERGWLRGGEGPVKLVNELFRKPNAPDWKIVDEVHSLVVVERKW